MQTRRRIGLASATALAVMAVASPALADPGRLDGIIDIYMNAAQSWEGTMMRAAMGIFGTLAVIDLAWTFIKLALKESDLTEFTSELVNRLIVIGFFLFLLTSAGPISHAIIDSFRQLGNDGSVAGNGSGGLRPTALFDAGMKAGVQLMNTKMGLAPAQLAKGFALMIAGIAVILCYAVLTAFLISALVESFLVTAAGMIFFGLGGSRWTRDFAVKQLTYCVSVGAKLLIIQLLAGTAEAMLVGWSDSVAGTTISNIGEVWTIVGAAVVMMALVLTLPGIVQGVVNGASPGNGGMMAAGGMMAGAVGAAAMSTAGAASAASSAMSLAGEQVKAEQESGQRGSGFGASVGGFMGHTMSNIGGAIGNDLGGQLSGRSRHGTMGGRMGEQMSSQRDELKAGREARAQEAAASDAGASQSSGAEDENTISGDGEQAGGGSEAELVMAGANESGAESNAGGSTSEADAMGAFVEDAISSQDAEEAPAKGSAVVSGNEGGVQQDGGADSTSDTAPEPQSLNETGDPTSGSASQADPAGANEASSELSSAQEAGGAEASSSPSSAETEMASDSAAPAPKVTPAPVAGDADKPSRSKPGQKTRGNSDYRDDAKDHDERPPEVDYSDGQDED
ncbi:MAG: P-type conjugative transfer protein TrbL [Pseudonocardiaceae bacterium]